VEREDKQRAGRLIGLLGFLLVIFTGLMYSAMNLPAAAGMTSVVLGIIMFVSGVELAIRNQSEGSADGEA
jgi:uncharacterized membrane protein HdeD (DUF308 family)